MKPTMRIAPPLLAMVITTGCAPTGELVDFVDLGTLRLSQVDPVELDGDGASDAMINELQDAAAEEAASGVGPNDDVDDVGAEIVDALEYQPPNGTRAFAFVLSGCQDTGAELVVEGESIEAELTGGEKVNCGEPNHFLATFTIDEDAIPGSARPR